MPQVNPRRIKPLNPQRPAPSEPPHAGGGATGATRSVQRRQPPARPPAQPPPPVRRSDGQPGSGTSTQPVLRNGRGPARAPGPNRGSTAGPRANGTSTGATPVKGSRQRGSNATPRAATPSAGTTSGRAINNRTTATSNNSAVNRTQARRATSTGRVGSVEGTSRSGAVPPRDIQGSGPVRSRASKEPNPLDTPANATAARLIAEGRARSAGKAEEAAEKSRSRRDRRHDGFDLASLAAIPAELRERVVVGWQRRRAKIASYTPKQRLWHRLRLAGIAGATVFLVIPVLAFFVGYLYFTIPTPDDAVNTQIATIQFTDGTELAKVAPPGGNRIRVDAKQIPKIVQYAVLSAEDRTFFTNPGFDFGGIARAVYKQLTGGQGGGSTITQQYVKKTLVGDEHSLWRKYKEMIIAVKISQQTTKEQILADYLNAIYFGRGAYGIESASKAYFNTDVWKLDAAQAALLAGVIQSPSRWDPAINPQHATERWNYVMDGLVGMGQLSQQDRDTAKFPVAQPPVKLSGGIPTDYRGLILSAVKDELVHRGIITEQQFNSEGLIVKTTIDPKAEQEAADAAQKNMQGEPDNLRTSLVSIDPSTGEVKAYYGGPNGVGLDYARVSKQPGSTFKPFVLLADLLAPTPEGIGTKFKGEPLPGLRNADGASCQVCDLKQAMTISNNVVYHELGMQVGPQKVADAASLAGITSPLKNPDAGIALGDKEVTPLELASAYATIAAQGQYRAPHLVAQVTTSDGRTLLPGVSTPTKQVFSQLVARNLIEAMLGVPTYDKLDLSGDRPLAAKTGTVQSYIPDQNNDAWTAGFTPKVATVVWVGTDQNTPIKDAKGKPIYGADLPGHIWKSFMYDDTKDDDPASFGPFKPIGTPPAVVGPNDGFMAGRAPAAAAPPQSSASGTDTPSTAPVDQAPPDRNCGLDGCHDATPDDSNGRSESRDDRDNNRDNGDDSDDDDGRGDNG